MSKDAKYYADRLVSEFKKPTNERKFTAADIPENMRVEVAKLLQEPPKQKTATPKQNSKQKDLLNAALTIGSLFIAPTALPLLRNPFVKKFITNAALGFIGSKVVDKTTEKISKGKYGSFGEYVYEASGLKKLTEGTALETGARIIAEFANPGSYLGFGAKPIVNKGLNTASKVANKVDDIVDSTPALLRQKHLRQNVNAAVDDLVNYTNVGTKAEPKIFTTAKQLGNKTSVKGVDVYTTNTGQYFDYADRPYFRNTTNTAALYKIGDNTYSLRLSPEQGKTLVLGDKKQVLQWIDGLPRHSYISGDFSSLPQGQIFTTMYKDDKMLPFIQNYFWPSNGVRLSNIGLSPDAYEYVAKLAQRPGYKLRYASEPMLTFNPLGAHGQNKAVYEGWQNALTGSEGQKQLYINEQLNPWLKNLGIDRKAYVHNGIIMIPHPVAYKSKLGGKIKKAE